MHRFLALAALAAAVNIIGCAATCPRPVTKPVKDPQLSQQKTTQDTEVYLTHVYMKGSQDAKAIEIDLTRISNRGIRIPTYLPIRMNHEFRLHILGEYDGKRQDYHALVGLRPNRDQYAEAQVDSSAARVRMRWGWVILTGEYPCVETDYVDSTADGTDVAVIVINHPDPNRTRHVVKNLEKPGSTKTVFVQRKNSTGPPIALRAGDVIAVHDAPSVPPGSSLTPDEEALLDYAIERAIDVGLISK